MVRLGEKLMIEEIAKKVDELEKDKKVQEYIQLMDTLKVKRELLKQRIKI